MSCVIDDEQLIAWIDGDLPEASAQAIASHVRECDRCRQRAATIRQADAALRSRQRDVPPAHAMLATRRALDQALRPLIAPEIMSLDEVAGFLRISGEQMAELMDDLPAFELAGQVRVRRTSLLQWLAERERDYRREANASWIARCTAVAIKGA